MKTNRKIVLGMLDKTAKVDKIAQVDNAHAFLRKAARRQGATTAKSKSLRFRAGTQTAEAQWAAIKGKMKRRGVHGGGASPHASREAHTPRQGRQTEAREQTERTDARETEGGERKTQGEERGRGEALATLWLQDHPGIRALGEAVTRFREAHMSAGPAVLTSDLPRDLGA